MAQPKEDTTAEPDVDIEVGEGSWRDRALDRSLKTARAKAMSRSDRFIATAMEILQETGRSDFTVQELVDRSRTSLRSFYQYFSGKDELLLALLEESIMQSVTRWREEIEGQDALTSLKTVVCSIYGNGSDPSDGLNRGLAPYHVGLSDTHTADYQRALSPLARLIRELVDRGVAEGAFRHDIPHEKLIPVFLQAVIGSAFFTALGGESAGARDAETMWEFCRAGLVGPDAGPAPSDARRKRG